jgi:hypothetical protein
VANKNEVQNAGNLLYDGKVIRYAGENMYDENEILFFGLPVKCTNNVAHGHLKLKKNELFITVTYFPNSLSLKPQIR